MNKFQPVIDHRRLHVLGVFPVKDADLLVFSIAERRFIDHNTLNDALYAQVQTKLPKGAMLRETQVHGDYLFVIEYDVPLSRVAYMEKRILIAVRKACEAFWGIHKIGKTPEFKAQWRKENPL